MSAPTQFCSQCGAAATGSVRFCRQCGTPMANAAAAQPYQLAAQSPVPGAVNVPQPAGGYAQETPLGAAWVQPATDGQQPAFGAPTGPQGYGQQPGYGYAGQSEY